MCGIFGILRPNGQAVKPGELVRALDTIRHRGPDDEGYLLADTRTGARVSCSGADTSKELRLPLVGSLCCGHDLALGHRRLSIIDLSPGGHQPMMSEDGELAIVFNGEIYNYIELRKELKELGHIFYNATDTEVILAAYRQWGSGMLSRFIGMFAFAIADFRARSVFLARDFFGIKPLYYTTSGNEFVFASEIKPLLTIDGVSRRGNPTHLYDYLAFATTDHGGETLFRDVNQLPAAHYAIVKFDHPSAISCYRYWSIDLEKRRNIQFDEAVETLRDLFFESVRLHMRSDVEVGSCLSGGLDSSAIVTAMAELEKGGGKIHTFSYILDDAVLGEEKYVDLIANRTGVTTHKVRSSAGELIDDLKRLILCQEQPFVSTSVYAQYRVFKLAHQQGIKVMLDGQGADEIFAGYYNMIGARVASLISAFRFKEALKVLNSSPSNMREYRLRMFAFSLSRLVPSKLVNSLIQLTGVPSFPPWIDQKWFRRYNVVPHMRLHGQGSEALRQESKASIEQLSLPQLLRYEDRNSMAFSIESRVPFCNPRIVEFALSLPENFLITDSGKTKAVFRDAVTGYLPAEIISREKVGFATPMREWLSVFQPWAEEIARGTELTRVPFMKDGSLLAMMSSEQQSRPAWSINAWRCLNIICWSNIFNVTWE